MGDFLVLANSIKKGGRCLAGILNPATQNPCLVRIVADENGGALNNNLPVLGKGNLFLLAPLDVITVSLGQPVPLPGQPENIILDSSKQIIYRRTEEKSFLANFLQNPSSIWGLDSISESNCPSSSLMLLYVANPKISKTYKDYPSLEFDYNGNHYNIRCTIENFGYKTIPVGVSRCIICVSSGTEYCGAFYKFVAGIIF